MKKVKFLLMAAVIVLSTMCCSMNAFALTEGDWEFKLLDNEVTITGYIGAGGDVVIPETIYGCRVTNIESDTFRETKVSIKSLTVLPKIKKLPSYLLDSAGNLEKVQLPEGLEVIGSGCFWHCKNLKTINLPSTLKIVEKSYVFADCSSLSEITFPAGLEEIGDGAFFGTSLVNVDLSHCTNLHIGDSSFRECKALKSVKLPDNLKVIEDETFYECSALTEVVLPKSLVTIDLIAFEYCSSLEQIIFPTSLKIISNRAFGHCDSLKEVVIPYGTETIRFAFQSCPNLKSLYIPDTVVSLDDDELWGSDNAIIYCSADSYTADFCKKNSISYLTDNSVNSGITVLYNGTRISFHAYGQNPELLESRTLVPLRSIFEAMGAEVEWDGATSTAIAKRNGVEVKIQIGANEMYKNGSSIPVDVPAMLLNSRTMVPVRVIAEAFGADVQWNGNGRTVVITE